MPRKRHEQAVAGRWVNFDSQSKFLLTGEKQGDRTLLKPGVDSHGRLMFKPRKQLNPTGAPMQSTYFQTTNL
jgi:hypothetical protein